MTDSIIEDSKLLLTQKQCDEKYARERRAAAVQFSKLEEGKRKSDDRLDAANTWVRRLALALVSILAATVGVKFGLIPHF